MTDTKWDKDPRKIQPPQNSTKEKLHSLPKRFVPLPPSSILQKEQKFYKRPFVFLHWGCLWHFPDGIGCKQRRGCHGGKDCGLLMRSLVTDGFAPYPSSCWVWCWGVPVPLCLVWEIMGGKWQESERKYSSCGVGGLFWIYYKWMILWWWHSDFTFFFVLWRLSSVCGNSFKAMLRLC